MPQNDIKLMHNFTTHLSRHALSHQGTNENMYVCVSVSVCVCGCNMCVVSLFGTGKIRDREMAKEQQGYVSYVWDGEGK